MSGACIRQADAGGAVDTLAPKPRYEILDGLRGVAAVVVVVFHLFEVYAAGPASQIVNHGYLAVDFFFVLSGFVVGYAYDDRWGRLTLREFCKRRLVRLHPMVVLGTAFGAALYYFGAGEVFPTIGRTPWQELLLLFVLGCTLLPAPLRWDIRGWGETYPLNGPSWSLMYEYIANLLYALLIRRFPKALLALFVAGTAVLTLDLTLDLDLFGLLAERSRGAYTVIGGWSLTTEQGYIGLARLLYPFFGGLLLSRLGWTLRLRNGFLWCALLVMAALAMPYVGGAGRPWLDGAYNAGCILLLFPLVVAIGAGSAVRGRRSLRVCRFLGAISYPLYLVHYPLIYLQTAWAVAHPDLPIATHVVVGVSVFLLSVGVAYASLKLYDEPVRAWLRRRWLAK